MFLDEELELIYKKDKYNSKLLFKALLERIKEPVPGQLQVFLNSIKQIDNSWKLFCSRHGRFRENAFREYILESDQDDKLKKALRL